MEVIEQMFISVQGAKEGSLNYINSSTPISCRLHYCKDGYRKNILVADGKMELEFLFSMADVLPEHTPGTPGYWKEVGMDIEILMCRFRRLHRPPKGAWYCISPRLGLGAAGQYYCPWFCFAYNGKEADHLALAYSLKGLYDRRSWEEIMETLRNREHASLK